MSSIIPEDIMTAEEAKKWLMKRGYGEQLAEEEIAKWEGPHDGDEDNEIEDIEEVEEDELTWDDEDDDEDEDWDDNEDDVEEDDWDDDDEDEDDK